jgi:hypothetical protein
MAQQLPEQSVEMEIIQMDHLLLAQLTQAQAAAVE